MRELVCQAWVVLAIRKVRDSEPKDGSNRHILPVVFRQWFGLKAEATITRFFLRTTVVHCPGNCDKRSTAEWNKRDPCFGLRFAAALSG